MRTKRLAGLATFLVAVLLSMSACLNEQIISPPSYCEVNLDLVVTNSGSALPIGSSDTVSVVQTDNCDTRYTFNFVSNNGHVSVTRLSPTSAQVTGVSAGTSVVTVTAVEDTSRQFLVTFVVPSTSSASSIDYTPHSGALAVGDSVLVTAHCVQGSDISEACNPFWTSSDPGTVTLRGTGPNGTGMTAWMKRIKAGSVGLCTQWSRTRSTPQRCYTRS